MKIGFALKSTQSKEKKKSTEKGEKRQSLSVFIPISQKGIFLFIPISQKGNHSYIYIR